MGEQAQLGALALQVTGLALAGAFMVILLTRKGAIHLPFKRWIMGDHELQLFAAALVCLGFAAMAALFHLSVAFGAFLAGMFVGRTSETEWVSNSLHSFKVVFMAFFFISIGLLVDMQFVTANLGAILLLVAAVFVVSTTVNFFVFRWLGESWRYSLIAGVLLSQAGEFGFLLVAAGLGAGVVDTFVYQTTVAVIAITLLFSPLWAGFFSRTLARLPCEGQTRKKA